MDYFVHPHALDSVTNINSTPSPQFALLRISTEPARRPHRLRDPAADLPVQLFDPEEPVVPAIR